MPSRRLFVAGLTMAAFAAPAAQNPSERGGPLRLGVDRALEESGLAKRLQRAFGFDTGIPVLLVPGPALAVLDAIRDGEIDAALVNAPGAEEEIDKQGLVHDRRVIATSEFVVVGPPPRGPARKRPPPGHSAIELLERIQAQAAGDANVVFLSAGDGSGVHVAEQALWRVARIAPGAPWYVSAERGPGFTAQVRARGAYALVERGAWSMHGGAPSAILVEGDPLLVESVHAMRAFRVQHPAGRIFVSWIAGGRGRAVVARHGGYRLR
jgi:tungstate transport system substrate-binding protein